jgi:hypothetical protein
MNKNRKKPFTIDALRLFVKKTAIPVTFLFIFLSLITLPTNAFAEFAEEMAGTTFGVNTYNHIHDLMLSGEHNGQTLYSHIGDKLNYRGIKLHRRYFGYTDDKLTLIMLWTDKKGPAHKYECTDLPAAATTKLHENLTERFGRHKSRKDTNLDAHSMRPVIKECNAANAYNCIVTEYSAEPPKDDLDARTFVATVTTFQWIRQRDFSTFTAEEVKKAKRGDTSVSLDEYTCQNRIEFTQGISRRQIDARAAKQKELLDLLFK